MGQGTPCLDHAGKGVGAGVGTRWITPYGGCCGETAGTGMGTGHLSPRELCLQAT